MNKKMSALILLTILSLSFSIASITVKGQAVNDKQATKSNLQKELDSWFLKSLGLSSNITVIDSNVELFGNVIKANSGGYDYAGSFSSGNLSYCIQSSMQQNKTGNSLTTKEKTMISGSMNVTFDQKEVNVTSDDYITTTHVLNAQIRNASGLYNLHLDSETLYLNSKTGASVPQQNLVSCRISLDQNLFAPIGKTTVNVTNQFASGLEMTAMLPDGNQITTKVGQSLPTTVSTTDVQNSNHMSANRVGTGGGYTTDDIIPGITDHGGEIYYDTRSDGVRLWCLWMWWLPSFELYSYLYWFVADLILGYLAVPLGIGGWVFMAVITISQGIAAYESGNYQASMPPYDVKIEYVDLEVKDISILGLFTISLPYCYEIGFYTNYVIIDNIRTYTGWYYYPLDTLCLGHLGNLYDIIQNKHESDWSLDPPGFCFVNFLCYDESNSTYLYNIPIGINNQWLPISNCISMPAQEYTITAPDDGEAFNCFYDGSSYYGNSALITISQDTTMTAYYNYIPTFNIEISANDPGMNPVQANVYLNSVCVGTTDPYTGYLSVSVPIGFYDLSADSLGWDNNWGTYVYLVTISSSSPVVAGETYVNLYYY